MIRYSRLPDLTRAFALVLFIGFGGAHAEAKDIGPLAGTPFEQHEVVDNLGRTVTYYVSHPPKPAPLMLMIQGSGCMPVFVSAGGQVTSTIYQAWPYALEGRFTVLLVDKPFSGYGPNGKPGTATGCSDKFNADFTAQRWLAALQAALADARALPWVDPSRTLVFGHSEGAVMAAVIAGHDGAVTDVIAFGMAGTSQLFDAYVQAYDRCFDRSKCFSDLEDRVRAINAKPDSAVDFNGGHTYKRASSFYRISAADELLRSKARVYLGSGTADESVPMLSTEVAAAVLLSAGRDVTIRLAPGADHSLNGPYSNTVEEYQRALDWFWAR